MLKRIERVLPTDPWEDAQLNLMLLLGFELGPRAIQFHSLDIADFEFFESTNHEKYYTLWLPMAKKVGQRRPERRPRKITTRLGEKISQHFSEIQRRFGSNCEPLFVNPKGRRLSVTEIGVGLKHELREAGIDKPNQDALMLAVSLASPSELEGPAERLKEVMRKPAGSRRQRIPPPEFAR
ncbi:hypothetical protein [Pseudomonas syringae]|uniref:hypothetical protein n=1 Tax=Pseudomonas syringae TaxID=317 RepID=UPI001E5DF728|nr:hypothetical protein [Pseudomonas syringae]